MTVATSSRYVALLRGINVGKAKQLSMADLKRVLEGLGYAGVQTYLRSGQAVFTDDGQAKDATARIAGDVEQAIATHLGMDVPVVVRSRVELAKVIAANPFPQPDRDPARMFCVFLSERVTAADLAGLDPADNEPDDHEPDDHEPDDHEPEEFALAPGGREIFLWLPNGMGVSRLGVVKWDRVTGQRQLVATARNWRTTLKLLELLDA